MIAQYLGATTQYFCSEQKRKDMDYVRRYIRVNIRNWGKVNEEETGAWESECLPMFIELKGATRAVNVPQKDALDAIGNRFNDELFPWSRR